MEASSSKKRKVSDEGRVFQEKWSEMFFFTCIDQKPVCLICNEAVAVMKEFNVKRHYETKHASKMDQYVGEARAEKCAELKGKLSNQQNFFLKRKKENELCTKASYVVAEKIASQSKAFSDGEFVKECLEAVVKIICPEKSRTFAQVSLSRPTITRRVEDIAGNVLLNLKEKAANFVYYSVALDESTDISDTAQLAVFVRGISDCFEVTEELARLIPMKGTTKGVDIFDSLRAVLEELDLPLKKLSGAVTDGAPAMCGKNEGAIAHLRKLPEVPDQFTQYHCIVHQENLCAKNVGFKDVMKDVIKIVNFIRSHALNHREFQAFLADVDAEYGDIPYFTEVRWLSRGKVLRRFFDLRKEIAEFMERKGKPVKQFDNAEWMSDLAFLADITGHLNDLNLNLQGKDKLVHNMLNQIKTFENKLILWGKQLENSNFAHFSTLGNFKGSSTKKYVDALQTMKNDFSQRFGDFKAQEENLNIFATPFSFDAQQAPENLQMELIELQCDTELREKFDNYNLLDFYSKFVTEARFPELRKHALFRSSLFGSTYICEQLFSTMKIVKSKSRNKITDDHLENSLRISTSSIKADLNKLAQEKCK